MGKVFGRKLIPCVVKEMLYEAERLALEHQAAEHHLALANMYKSRAAEAAGQRSTGGTGGDSMTYSKEITRLSVAHKTALKQRDDAVTTPEVMRREVPRVHRASPAKGDEERPPPTQ